MSWDVRLAVGAGVGGVWVEEGSGLGPLRSKRDWIGGLMEEG